MRLGWTINSAHGWAAGYGLYSAASLVWTSGDHLWAPLWLGSLVIAYVIGASFNRLDWIWLVAFGVATLNIPICIWQWYGLEWYGFGVFGNPNYYGAFIAICVAIAITERSYWFLPFAMFGLWWCQSRAALIVTGVVVLIGLSRRFPVSAYLTAIACVISILAYRPDASSSMFERIGVWQDTLNHLTIFGHGIGSFAAEYATWVPRRNMIGLAPHAYNDFLEVMFEVGIGSLFLWIAIIQSLQPHPLRLALIATLLLSLTYFPFYIPGVAHLVAIVLGNLARRTQNAMETNCTTLSQSSGNGMGIQRG